MPLAALGARDVPHGAALGAAVHPDVDLQVPGAVAVPAVQEEAELDAVGVVLAERQQEQLGPLAAEVLRGVDHHEGPWRRKNTHLMLVLVKWNDLRRKTTRPLNSSCFTNGRH